MSRLLQGVGDPEKATAAAALEACPTIALRVGNPRAGARIPDCAALVVEEGVVLVTSARTGASRRMILAVAGPGAVLLPPGRDERFEALADSWLTAITPAARERLLELPGARETLLDGLVDELRERQESLAHFSSVRHVDRVRDKLIQLARVHGKVVPDGVRLDLPLTHELVGEMVGSARETVTWAFAQLAREGFVSREGRSYRLAVSPEALAS
jgi:CRP-like cAMP-binding protein